MANHKIEVALSQEVVFNATQYHCFVTFTYFRNDDPDRVTALCPKRPRDEVCAVTWHFGGLKYPPLGFQRNGIRKAGPVEHQRNGGGRKLHIAGQVFEAWPLRKASITCRIFGLHGLNSCTSTNPIQEPLFLLTGTLSIATFAPH